MIEDTETYYRRREREELAAAEHATDPVAADIHRSLAARYAAFTGHLTVLRSPGQGDVVGATRKLNPQT